MSETMVERVAAAIRNEIDILLGDYSGDLCNGAERTPKETALAEARLEALDWLRERWKPDALFSEERLEGVARAAIEAMREPTEAMIVEAMIQPHPSVVESGGMINQCRAAMRIDYQAMIDAVLKPSETED